MKKTEADEYAANFAVTSADSDNGNDFGRERRDGDVSIRGAKQKPRRLYHSKKQDHSFYHGLSSNVASAISTANRLESTTNSTTSYTLGLVRQYIYSMDQVNQMCANLTGKTYVPQDAFTALYSDLENYQALVLTNKKSTVETREMLLTHLSLVQGYINGELTS